MLPRATIRYVVGHVLLISYELTIDLADAAAGGRGHETVKINEEDALYTYKAVGSPFAGWFSAKPLFDLIHKETNGDYLE